MILSLKIFPIFQSFILERLTILIFFKNKLSYMTAKKPILSLELIKMHLI